MWCAAVVQGPREPAHGREASVELNCKVHCSFTSKVFACDRLQISLGSPACSPMTHMTSAESRNTVPIGARLMDNRLLQLLCPRRMHACMCAPSHTRCACCTLMPLVLTKLVTAATVVPFTPGHDRALGDR